MDRLATNVGTNQLLVVFERTDKTLPAKAWVDIGVYSMPGAFTEYAIKAIMITNVTLYM